MASRNTRTDAGRSLKRRKTRKGTRSCWQCKRRKVKCTYASPADDVCIGCARRCLDCIGQEFPDQDPGPSSKGRLLGDRIGRLESMIQQLAEQVGDHVTSSSPSVPASISLPVGSSKMQSKHQTLSQKLLAAYPSLPDLSIMSRTGGTLALYLTLTSVTPSHLLETRVALESERLWGAQQQRQQYTTETHPVLIARQMLLLACVLQHLHAVGPARSSSSRYRLLGKLSRPPRALARRLAEAATTLVTAHDRFTSNTLEGLECLWLEAVYHEHNGRPRQCWLTCRRAISAVQLMGFPGRRCTPMELPKSILKQPGGDAADLEHIWLGLVHKELELCLVLDVPPSVCCPDDIFTSVQDSGTTRDDATHTSKLERQHAAIARDLIDRSERDPDFEDLDATRQIRTELEEAATAMPSGWWLNPSLADPAWVEAEGDQHLFGAMMKLRTQIFHSYLILLSHLPYMLQAIGGAPTTTTPDAPSYHQEDHTRDHNHLLASSRNICVDASRDLLRRFVHLRSCERTAGYIRLLDHYAWQAAATLLLSRLFSGRRTIMTGTTTSLGGPDYQQDLSDRAMALEAIERIRLEEEDEEEDGGDEEVYYNYSSGAAVNGGTGDALRRLLALEAGGDTVVLTYRKPGAAFSGSGSGVPVDEDQDTILLCFPFAGIFSISPQDQHGSAIRETSSLLSSNTGFFSIVHQDKGGHQGFDGRVEDEFEDDDDDDANLTRAVNLRRGGNWPTALYLCLLRPVI